MEYQRVVKPTQKEPSKTLPSSLHQTSLNRVAVRPILELQRTIGNQAVQNLLRSQNTPIGASTQAFREPRFGHDFSRIPIHSSHSPVLQTKLVVNKLGDQYEQEADHISEQVMRMPVLRPSQSIVLQRKCACGGSSESEGECAECKAKREAALQRRAANPRPPSALTVPPVVHNVLSSPGQPLDAGTRAFMEPRFGQDFSHVRVHIDATAAESARAVNALAYTVGSNVVFGAGQYAPGTSEGRRLMAHELTHVVQQEGNSQLSMASLALGAPGDVFELEAQTIAEHVMSRPSVNAASATTRWSKSRMTLHRQPDTCPPDPQDEPLHPGTCPEIVRESGELERFAAIGPSVETIAPVECFLIWNLGSGSTDFGTPPELSQIADLLRFDPSAKLIIVGYSDCVGQASLNASLRLNRASEVEDYLVRGLGVDPARILFKAAPATEYVDTNDTPEGRARNRSVALGISTTTGVCTIVPCSSLPFLVGSYSSCGVGDDFRHADFPFLGLEDTIKVTPFRLESDSHLLLLFSEELGLFAGSIGISMISRFVAGSGATFPHGLGSTLSTLAAVSGSFLGALGIVKSNIESQLRTQATIGTIDCNLLTIPSASLPRISFTFTDGPTLKAAIGGTQGLAVSILSFSVSPGCRAYTMTLRFTICDNFGVDKRDLYSPGLISFWELQHERTPSAYVPFINEITVEPTISGTL